ncbi:Glu/Leu/Phe/Val dehydrogenase family protein [Thorsellia anophelis]|uniref:Leucine dehydrogenase n=1 Tax=Thorsellia anophelis DSM 18579 TaxID=1123402 RepID=A0A1H9Z9Y4_9GAMM|nr:Glu/Leu/Phe/Val dehydrogenase family protein [Thorsellia anophelis]SES78415.1 leucine dehydrogenase [Thorsellia anophelis DSM 18579]
MTRSLFYPLEQENLTTLKIRYDYKTDIFNLFAAKEWENSFNFSQYNKTFFADGLYTNQAIYLNTNEVEELFNQYHQTEYLNEIKSLIREGRHHGIECYFLADRNIRFMCNQHSLGLGINNKSHAIMAGGIRRHPLDEPEKDVIIDGLNLGRAMSFKNVAAGLAFGGCKTTVHMDPLDLNDMHTMGFLAFALDRSRSMTGPDMNFPTEMADVMGKNFSVQFTGGPNAPLGETGKPTAYGTFVALKEAVKFHYQDSSKSLSTMSVAVQGLGAVGWYMAEHLIEAGASLIVTDINKDRSSQLKTKYPLAKILIVEPDEILSTPADILCPCAMGGIITEENINTLPFKLIFGPANNQLRATGQETEIKLAKQLEKAGILYQIEWWHNTAGVLCGAEEYFHGPNATYENLIAKIEEIVPKKTIENLTYAKEHAITPTESAYRLSEQIIYR